MKEDTAEDIAKAQAFLEQQRKNKKVILHQDGEKPKEVPDIACATSDIEQRLVELSNAARQRRLGLESYAAKRSSITCPYGKTHSIDLDASSRASAGKPDYVLVYKPCPKCQRESDLAANQHWLRNAGVPVNLLHCDLDNWKARNNTDRKVLSEVANFSAKPSGILVLYGPIGTGKSHLAVAVMRRLRYGRFRRQNQLLFDLRATYRSDTIAHPLEIAANAKLYVLDEIMEPDCGRDELPLLYEILHRRIDDGKPTILTLNLTLEELTEVYGDRLIDRIAEIATFVKFSGESMRGTKI